MPTWGDLVEELGRPENRLPNGQPNHDRVRRKYLAELFQRTARPVIVYGTAFLQKQSDVWDVSIELGDLQGFMNALAGISGPDLDLIITSPGGSAEATESIVSYLRTRFDNIRAFVPVAAMSAATMLALGCDEIVMGKHSQLGPIDPQFTIFTPDGPRMAPGQAILNQFEKAKTELQDPANIGAWMPILRSYLPGLLAMCEDQQAVAKTMVTKWLKQYMLRDDPDRDAKADTAAAWFANYKDFGSHSRRVSLDDVRSLGLKGRSLEEDQQLQDAVLSVYHCYAHTFSGTGALKIIENHLGKAYVRMMPQLVFAGPPPNQAPQRPPFLPSPPGTPRLPRAERRRQGKR